MVLLFASESPSTPCTCLPQLAQQGSSPAISRAHSTGTVAPAMALPPSATGGGGAGSGAGAGAGGAGAGAGAAGAGAGVAGPWGPGGLSSSGHNPLLHIAVTGSAESAGVASFFTGRRGSTASAGTVVTRGRGASGGPDAGAVWLAACSGCTFGFCVAQTPPSSRMLLSHAART